MPFCSKCLFPGTEKDIFTINFIRQEYLKDNTPWYVGYSGGKDSSALLSLLINSLLGLHEYCRPVTVIFCDTGVENPVIVSYVYETFKNLEAECCDLKIPIQFKIVKPKLEDRFFVKVIGKGYPTPTNIFRWCTKSLRINPVKKVIDNTANAVILLGVRNSESVERDRTIAKHKSNTEYYLRQNKSTENLIFAPILDYNIKDVWSTIKFKNIPISIDHEIIGKLYKDAGSECPIFKESSGSPCGKGRFGCWTCTVVRKDRSVEKMIENGYEKLIPLFGFRNWIAEFRDDKRFRCRYRRNGKLGLGPFTLEGRKIILEKLLAVERETGMKILQKEERELIQLYWNFDQLNPNYIE
jgi:DNA sulfur modification protein DndC